MKVALANTAEKLLYIPTLEITVGPICGLVFGMQCVCVCVCQHTCMLACVPMYVVVGVNARVWARPGWPGCMNDSWPEKVSQSGPALTESRLKLFKDVILV